MRSYFLQTMGIDVWRLRSQPQVVTPTLYSLTLCDAEHQPVGLLLADRVDNTDEEKQLVLAMARATQLQVQQVDAVNLDQLDSRVRVVILLGASVASCVLKASEGVEELRGKVHSVHQCSVVVSYSVSQLLADKALKAAAWKDLQLAMKQR